MKRIIRNNWRAALSPRALAAVTLAAGASLAHAQQYTVTDLGTLGGSESLGYAVNQHGQVAGWARIGTGQRHAFRWTNGVMQNLGVVSGHTESQAHGINDLGVVVGRSWAGTDATYRAFKYDDSLPTPFVDLTTAGLAIPSQAWDINNAGQITGRTRHSDGLDHAFRTDGATVTILPGGLNTNNPRTYGHGINEAGHIVGYAGTTNNGGQQNGFYWYGSGNVQGIAPFAGNNSYAFDINESGGVVGTADTNNLNHNQAFRFENDNKINLGTLGGIYSEAQGINDSGTIVGISSHLPGTASPTRAFISNGQAGGMADLNNLIENDAGWVLTQARDISHNGYIVGQGTVAGQSRAFLAVPIAQWANPAGGAWAGNGNWSPPSTPLNLGDARFNLGSVGGYTVNLAAPTQIGRLLVLNDKPTLNLNGNRLTVGSAVQLAELAGQNAQLVVTNGTLKAGNVSVGGSSTTAGGAAALKINANGTLAVGGTLKIWNSANSRVELNGGKLIVANGELGAWDGANYTGITGLIRTGRNGGAWNGTGITTSEPLAVSHITDIAVASAAQLNKTAFAGESVAPDDVLVMYTYAGDANLSGGIDADDFFRIDTGYAGGLKGYFNGDFDYSGKIDADDYFLIDRGYAAQTAPFFPAAAIDSSPAAVPEPSGAALILAAAASMLRRRRQSP